MQEGRSRQEKEVEGGGWTEYTEPEADRKRRTALIALGSLESLRGKEREGRVLNSRAPVERKAWEAGAPEGHSGALSTGGRLKRGDSTKKQRTEWVECASLREIH